MTTEEYTTKKTAVLSRLKRIERQVRGVEKMVGDDRYCIEVIQQVSTITRALQTVALYLLDEQLTHCFAEAVKSADAQKELSLIEASQAIARLVKS